MAAKQYDSGIHDQQIAKANEAVSFNGTFDSVPDVFVTSYSTAEPAKGTGATSITTTGFNIYSETTGNTGWVARETGFDEGSSSSSSSTSSSSSSSSRSSSSSSSSSRSSSSRSSSSSSRSSSSTSSSSATPGTVVYGHHTGTTEDYDENFVVNWIPGGWVIDGTAGTDAETISAEACGAITESEPWYLGSMIAVVRI
ncbi:MAG: hypothetical protein ACTSX1_09720, partial [Candidatus Heimdallarchaeaceae archaeon]